MLTNHCVLVVMDQFTRRIVGVGVHADTLEGVALRRMFNHATTRQGTPHCLSSDNGPPFEYHRWQASLRILDVEVTKTVYYIPWSHPFAGRLIGTSQQVFPAAA